MKMKIEIVWLFSNSEMFSNNVQWCKSFKEF